MNNLTVALFSTLATLSPLTADAATTHPLPPLPTAYRAAAPPPAGEAFTFVAGGDNRSTAHGEPMPPSTQEIFREIGLIGPNLVIWTGDDIEGYDDTPAEIDGEYKTFLGLASLTHTPVYGIPGNHEIGFDPANAGLYKHDMGPDYGSFDYAGSHFIGLDSTPVEPDGKIHEGDIDADQLAWLKSDLAANQGATNIFIFFHHYMYGPPDPDVPNSPDTGLADTGVRDKLHQLFVQFHVRAVFNGHDHLFYHQAKDGIDYYIAGNAGAPLDAAPENGGFLGYSLVHVNGKQLTVQNLTPWALLTRTVSGNDGHAAAAKIAVSAYDFYDLNTRGISVLMPKSSGYEASGEMRYKGKAPKFSVVIDHVEHVSSAVSRVFLKLPLKHHRTTYVTVFAR